MFLFKAKSNIFLSNIFLFLLIIFSISFAYLSIGISNNQTDQQDTKHVKLDILIQDVKYKKYNNQYQIESKKGSFLLESLEYYNPGNSYLIQGDLEYFDTKNSGIEVYYLSNGIIGKVKNVNKLKEYNRCSIKCIYIKSTKNLKLNLNRIYDSYVCKSLHFISEWFGNNCQDVLAYSLGLTIGDGNMFSSSSKANLKNLGLTHLVVVSGSQVGLVVSFMEFITIKLGLSRKKRFSFYVIGIFVLISIVGIQAPVLRSSLSVLISTFCAIFLGRRLNPYRALAYSGCSLLLLNNHYLISYSFWLSFAATFGLIITTQFSIITENNWLNSKWELVSSCIGTFLYTLPLTINLSGGISPAALISNIFLLPFIPFITIINLLIPIPIIGEFAALLATILQNLLVIIIKDFGKYITIIKVDSFQTWEVISYWIVITTAISLTKIITSKKLPKLINSK